MKVRSTVIGALSALLALAQPALAETVVVKCSVTSGDPAGVMGWHDDAGVGATVIYKIGDGQWLEWDEARGAWQQDRCRYMFYKTGLLADGPAVTGGCSFSPTEFDAGLSRLKGPLFSQASLTIDRRTGALTIESVRQLENGPPTSAKVTGHCEPTEEPSPPATKF